MNKSNGEGEAIPVAGAVHQTNAAQDAIYWFRSSPNALMVLEEETLNILEANEAISALIGMKTGELLGGNFLKLIPGSEAREAARRILHWAPDQERSQSVPPHQMKLQRADGFILLAELQGFRYEYKEHRNRIFCHLRDVTENEVTSRQAWADTQAASYQQLIECIGDGLLVIDNDQVIVYANTSGEQILQRSRSSLVGLGLDRLFPQLFNGSIDTTFERILAEDSHEPLRIPFQVNGQAHPLELVIYPHGEGVGILFRDISEVMRHELEVSKLNATMAVSQELLRRKNSELNDSLKRLEEMNQELERADQFKSEFLANTSHELRTPLNSIIGFLQLISEGLCEDPEEERQYIDNALVSAMHLLTLITEVLDIAKIEAGKMTLLIDDVNIETLFQEVHSLTYVQAQKEGLDMSYDVRCEDEESAVVRVDINKTKQVLVNLVSNSIKFTRGGGIRMWAEPDTQRSDMMRFAVQDTGIGVKLEHQQSIFEKFIQVDGTSTRKYQGTGLGLTICKNLVEMMGGEISAFSEGEGKGTTMYFTVPKGGKKNLVSDGCAQGGMLTEESLPQSF